MEKRFRVSFDIAVSFSDFDVEGCVKEIKEQSWEGDIPSDEELKEWALRDLRLLQAFRKDKEAVDKMIRAQIRWLFDDFDASWFDSFVNEYDDLFKNDYDEDELLMPIINTLDEEDRNFFFEMKRDERLWENTRHFWNAVRRRVDRCFIKELKPGKI